MIKNKKKHLISLAFWLSLFGVFIYFETKRRDSFHEHLGFTTGYLYKYDPAFQKTSFYNAYYYYTVKGETYKEYAPEPDAKDGIEKELTGKLYLVAYDTLNPTSSDILIFPADYKYVGKTIPDSNLKWISPIMYKYRIFDK